LRTNVQLHERSKEEFREECDPPTRENIPGVVNAEVAPRDADENPEKEEATREKDGHGEEGGKDQRQPCCGMARGKGEVIRGGQK
jgi:hypothetical protein